MANENNDEFYMNSVPGNRLTLVTFINNMASSRYRKFLRLCHDWPVDKTKGPRDLGSFIRERVAAGFKQGEATKINEAECDEKYRSLMNINANIYKNKYPRTGQQCGATGFSATDCRDIISEEAMDFYREEGYPTVFKRLKYHYFNKET